MQKNPPVPTSAFDTPPKTSAKGLFRAAIREAVKKTPFVGSLVTVVLEAEQETRAFRREYWASQLAGDGDDAAAFVKQLEAGLRGAEADVIRAAVLEGARAAGEAIDEAAIPAIARLTRMYLETGTPDRHTYRDLLAVLGSLDAEMLDGLRTAVAAIVNHGIADNDEVSTEFVIGDEPGVVVGWIGDIEHVGEPFRASSKVELLRGPMIERIAAAMITRHRGLFDGIARLAPPHFRAPVVRVLHSILG